MDDNSAADEKRKFLDKWIESKGTASDLASRYPDCACEQATASPKNGLGPVEDTEILRYFYVSRSDGDLKSRKRLQPTPRMFDRAFKGGMSVVRLQHASREEVYHTADELSGYQKSLYGNEFGGILGVADFSALAMRIEYETEQRMCCVLDTPLDNKPSHADVVYNLPDIPREDQPDIRNRIFNSAKIPECYKTVDDVEDVDLKPFLPSKLKAS
ncbi:hypothetical protein MACH10_37830 [Thalassospira tepidiphila]|nr:hypothetical protein MACH10_37830 [Thalassospira tepidiphila]